MKKLCLSVCSLLAAASLASADIGSSVQKILQNSVGKRRPGMKISVTEKKGAPAPFHLLDIDFDGRKQEAIVLDVNGKMYLINGGIMELSEDGLVPTSQLWKAKSKPVSNVKVTKAPTYSPKEVKGKLVVFSDPECPFCQRFMTSAKKVSDDYGLELYVYEFPLPFHKHAKDYVYDLLALNKLTNKDNTLEFYSIVQKSGHDFSKYQKALDEKLSALGIPKDQFKKTRDSEAVNKELQEEKDYANSFNISGTPTALLLDKDGNGYKIIANPRIIKYLMTSK